MRYISMVGIIVVFFLGLMVGYNIGLASGRENGYKEACQDAQTGKLKMTAITQWEWKK